MRSVTDTVSRIRRAAPRVVVVGDAILDRWWRGSSTRLTREAPAPVVDVSVEVDAVGGAANTAANVAALGGRAVLVTAIGSDAAGDRLVDELRAAGVDASGVVRAASATTVKTRIVADDQVLARVDSSGTDAAPPVEALGDRLASVLDGADALVVSDYGSAGLPDAVARALETAVRPPLIVVDAHEVARWRWLRPDVVTPNSGETELLLRGSIGSGAERAATAAARADDLAERAGAAAVVVTLDRDGSVLLRRGAEPVRTHAHPVAERYASGAGDTYTAALATAAASGADLADAVRVAQCAADVVVGRDGTAVCAAADLLANAEPAHAVLDADRLADAVAEHRARGRRIVFTNGCFDVLHVGHTSYLRQAAELGDVLVVAVNSDDSVRRLKGPDRPVNAQAERAALLAALAWVDLVTVFPEDTPIGLLERVQPDVYVKGGDYSPTMLEETPVVEAYGGEVRVVDYVPEHSTTELVARIRAGAPSEELS